MITRESCSYVLLDNGIHKFVFNESNRHAVDEHVAILKELYQNSNPDTIIRVLIDLRPAGWPPMSYTMSSLQKLNAQFPKAPKQRYAFLYSQGALFSVAQSFFNIINRNMNTPANFFKGDMERQAMDWLLRSYVR
jgi:hypothetical protein